MNLRADLIFANEQRSASMVSMRSISRVATIVVPTLLVLLVAFVVTNMITLSRRVKNVEREWAAIEPNRKQALKVLEAAKLNEAIFDEVEAWKESGVHFAPQLLSLQKSISPNIQLNSLRISQVLNQTDKGITARTFSLVLAGMASSATAEIDVETLQKHFLLSDSFKDLIDSATIPKYGADPDNKANRIFELKCDYIPSPFE